MEKDSLYCRSVSVRRFVNPKTPAGICVGEYNLHIFPGSCYSFLNTKSNNDRT